MALHDFMQKGRKTMRKKRYTLMTLALAGGMAFGGVGVLSQKISYARAEKTITTEKKNVDFSEGIDDVAQPEEKDSKKKISSKRQNIRLPEGAELKAENEKYLKILWGSHLVTYFLSDTEKESGADMTIEEVVVTAIKSIQEYTKQNNIGKSIEISLQRNILGDNGCILTESGETVSVINKKNYGIKYYKVNVDGTNGHSYSLRINSVTGQVFGYVDFYNKDDGTQRGYGDDRINEMEQEYTLIARDFVKEHLNLGNVMDYLSFTTGIVETENGSRELFNVSCKTEEGDIVVITIDQSEKFVVCFEVNPLLN